MNQKRLVSTFLQLTSISSPSGNEGLIREYVLQELQRLGLNYQIDKVGNIYGLKKGIGEPVLMCAHLDTVEPCSNVNPVIDGKWIKSDGETVLGADNKAALTAILECLWATKDVKSRPVEFLFTVREETDGGINYFNAKKLKSKVGLVADSGLPIGSIILKTPHIADLEITVAGKSTHTSTPLDGINALTATITALSKTKWGKVDFNTTANIGIIEGGQATNTIPDKIILKGEIRSFKKSLLEKTFVKIMTTFKSESIKNKSKLDFKFSPYCEGYEVSSKDKDIQDLKTIMERLKIKTKFENSFGGSDANVLFSNGIKVINIGEGAQDIHTTKERILISDLEKLSQIFIEYLKVS